MTLCYSMPSLTSNGNQYLITVLNMLFFSLEFSPTYTSVTGFLLNDVFEIHPCYCLSCSSFIFTKF